MASFKKVVAKTSFCSFLCFGLLHLQIPYGAAKFLSAPSSSNGSHPAASGDGAATPPQIPTNESMNCSLTQDVPEDPVVLLPGGGSTTHNIYERADLREAIRIRFRDPMTNTDLGRDYRIVTLSRNNIEALPARVAGPWNWNQWLDAWVQTRISEGNSNGDSVRARANTGEGAAEGRGPARADRAGGAAAGRPAAERPRSRSPSRGADPPSHVISYLRFFHNSSVDYASPEQLVEARRFVADNPNVNWMRVSTEAKACYRFFYNGGFDYAPFQRRREAFDFVTRSPGLNWESLRRRSTEYLRLMHNKIFDYENRESREEAYNFVTVNPDVNWRAMRDVAERYLQLYHREHLGYVQSGELRVRAFNFASENPNFDSETRETLLEGATDYAKYMTRQMFAYVLDPVEREHAILWAQEHPNFDWQTVGAGMQEYARLFLNTADLAYVLDLRTRQQAFDFVQANPGFDWTEVRREMTQYLKVVKGQIIDYQSGEARQQAFEFVRANPGINWDQILAQMTKYVKVVKARDINLYQGGEERQQAFEFVRENPGLDWDAVTTGVREYVRLVYSRDRIDNAPSSERMAAFDFARAHGNVDWREAARNVNADNAGPERRKEALENYVRLLDQ